VFEPLRQWPEVARNPEAIQHIQPAPYLSLDWEWDKDGQPTILGVSDGKLTVSVPHERGKPYLCELLERHPDAEILGHNFLQADLAVAEREDIRIDPAKVQDTILWHWLTSMSLCKGSKAADEEGEKRGRGFMNLFAMCSLHTSAPNWKQCWGDGCEESGRPCPEHDPYGYNGNDCYWPVHAMPSMLRRARMLGVDRLYPLHRDVSVVLAKMVERGVLVNVSYVNQLRREFERDAKAYYDQLAEKFNPDSPKQIVAYFKAKGIALENAQEDTIREACEEHADEDLQLLLDYKELGNGPDRWFAPREFDFDKGRWKGYVDRDGVIHGSFAFFTSTGRLLAFNPNLQNIAKRRIDRKTGEKIGKRIRRAIIARGGYRLYRADYKSAENYSFLYMSGYKELPKVDLHNWLKDIIGLKETDEFAKSLGGAREASKSVFHANDYMEGLKLVERQALHSSKMLHEVAAGARIVFPDWTFQDKVVTFTGINLANRAFGEASYANRKRALDVQQSVFAAFPNVRGLQRRITAMVERERCVRAPHGYVCSSYGYPEDRLKTAAAMMGSNPVAHFMKLALLNAAQHPHLHPILTIHDEIVYEVDRRHEPKQVASWIHEAMEVETPEMPGLRLPVEVSSGDNWTDQQTIE